MPQKNKASEHLEELELNKLLKYLCQKNLWVYYIMVRLGVSTALRFSDLSRIRWADVLNTEVLILKEKNTNKVWEIPLHPDLVECLRKVYQKIECPNPEEAVIPLQLRTINKQIKIHAAKAGIRGKKISTHTWRKTFGREVWKRNNCSEGSLVKLAELFNHSSVSITRRYLAITKGEIDDLYNLQDLFVY